MVGGKRIRHRPEEMNEKSTDEFHQQECDSSFVCVHCSKQCASLYRRLSSSASSIKVVTCPNCHNVADPYIERESILVGIDCILLRQEAFRHLLYNAEGIRHLRPQKILQLLLAWSFLDSYVHWETTKKKSGGSHQTDVWSFILGFAVNSILCRILQVAAVSYFCFGPSITKAKVAQLSSAVLIPCSFSVVILLVAIWDKTKMAPMLGSVLVTTWQSIGITAISPDYQAPLIYLLSGLLFWMQASYIGMTPSHPVVIDFVDDAPHVLADLW